jgi:nucleosome assembly protein 1-like 1
MSAHNGHKSTDVEKEQTASLSEELLSESEDEATPMKMTNNAVTKEMLKNPALLSALQGKLDSMAGTKSGYIESLPPAVRRRIKSLKKLQLETTKIEAKFYEEVHQLECKYHDHYTPLYEKRAQISKGTYEPTEVECDWPSEDEDEELADEIKDKVKLDGEKKDEEKKDDEPPPKGIPEFWLTIFKNVDMLQEMVQEHDEPVLAALTDVKVTFSDGSNQSSPMGFKLHFYFEPNEYFTNSELTKEYEMKCAPPEGDPFSFDGPEIYRCKGCAINWKQGKNLTVKTVKKKQKHKSKGNVRTITKQVKNDSFFNFFDPPPLPEDPEAEVDAETQELLTADFEIGHYIRERIIPRAVLFFTGEALEEDDYDEEEEEEGSDGEEGEDEEDDPDFDPSKVKGGENPQECKQQ